MPASKPRCRIFSSSEMPGSPEPASSGSCP
jgi:hypothetical protein